MGSSHWHEHWTVVCSTQLGHAVQEDGGHLLILVFYETEDLKGKAAHLALPVLKDGGLGVFLTAGSGNKGQTLVIRKGNQRKSEPNSVSSDFNSK